jgi:hypothetical protein
MKFVGDREVATPVVNVTSVVNRDGHVSFYFAGDQQITRRFSEEAAEAFIDSLCRDIMPAPAGYFVAYFYKPEAEGESHLLEKVPVIAFLVSRERHTMAVPITARNGAVDMWDENLVLVEPSGTATNEEHSYDSVDDFVAARMKAEVSK